MTFLYIPWVRFHMNNIGLSLFVTIKEACEMSSNLKGETTYIRLRGLPFSARDDQVRDFLKDVAVASITLPPLKDGRASGEAYCGLKSKVDVEAALKLHKQNMDSRYIEVFELSAEELSGAVRRGLVSEEGRILKLRGIPFSAQESDIKDFLKGLECEEVIMTKSGGRPSGEAFVRLASKEEAATAMERNKMHMGQRYVEVYMANVDEVQRARGYMVQGGAAGSGPRPLRDIPLAMMPPPLYGPPPIRHAPLGREGGAMRGGPPGVTPYSRSAPYDLPRPLGTISSTGDEYISPTKVFLRGLPFDVSPQNIEDFFCPLRCIEIKIGLNEERRPSGDGCVEFGTMSEAREALSRDKHTIGKRYIELYSSSEMPVSMRRLQFRTIGGAPLPPATPLSGYTGLPPRGPSYPPSGGLPPRGPSAYPPLPPNYSSHKQYSTGYGDMEPRAMLMPPSSGLQYAGGRGPAPSPSTGLQYGGGRGGAPLPPQEYGSAPHRGEAYSSFPSRYDDPPRPCVPRGYDGYGGYDRHPPSSGYTLHEESRPPPSGEYTDNTAYNTPRKSWLY